MQNTVKITLEVDVLEIQHNHNHIKVDITMEIEKLINTLSTEQIANFVHNREKLYHILKKELN